MMAMEYDDWQGSRGDEETPFPMDTVSASCTGSGRPGPLSGEGWSSSAYAPPTPPYVPPTPIDGSWRPSYVPPSPVTSAARQALHHPGAGGTLGARPDIHALEQPTARASASWGPSRTSEPATTSLALGSMLASSRWASDHEDAGRSSQELEPPSSEGGSGLGARQLLAATLSTATPPRHPSYLPPSQPPSRPCAPRSSLNLTFELRPPRGQPLPRGPPQPLSTVKPSPWAGTPALIDLAPSGGHARPGETKAGEMLAGGMPEGGMAAGVMAAADGIATAAAWLPPPHTQPVRQRPRRQPTPHEGPGSMIQGPGQPAPRERSALDDAVALAMEAAMAEAQQSSKKVWLAKAP